MNSRVLHARWALLAFLLDRCGVGPRAVRRGAAPSHLLLLGFVAAFAAACGTDGRPSRAELNQYDLRPDAGPSPCTIEGCACANEGEVRACGNVKEKKAGYTWCALGTRTCSDGKWTACEIERTAMRRNVLNKRVLALGQSESCSDENPCEPGCNWFQDTPADLELGPDAGVVEVNGRLVLPQVTTLDGACESVTISPATTTLELSELGAVGEQRVTFTANIAPQDCMADDTPVLWGVDRPDLATISESGELTLLQPFAGTLTVNAHVGRLSARALVEVHLHLQDNSEAPAGSEALLEGPGVAPDDVTLLYPYADTVFPLGVNPPKLQWRSVAQIEAVWNGGCALRLDGRASCWGTNYHGEITNRRVGPYTQLSGRYNHFCALTPSGDVRCWGANAHGQADAHTGPFVQVSAGNDHTCAVRKDGSVECWGYNNYGQLDAPPGNYVRVSAGHQVTCAIRDTGSLECWGNDAHGQVGVRQGPYIDVSVGSAQVCAIKKTRQLECWGGASYGENVAPPGAYVMVDAGGTHNCALRTDGAAVCFGLNNYGQSVTQPGPFLDVTAANRHSCGLLGTGRVQCWGDGVDKRTLGLTGGGVKVGLRYPATGTPSFTWSAIAPESVIDFVDGPRDSVPLVPAPRFPIPKAVWDVLASSARGDEFVLTLQRHSGERLLEPVERRLRFADRRLNGRILYQSYGSRDVPNTTGTYEDPATRWGAVIRAFDTRTNRSAVVAGFESEAVAAGQEAGCRGCHAAAGTGEQIVAGYDTWSDALLLDGAEPESGALLSLPNEAHGGALWSALHPSEPLMFTSSGPSPCATRVDGTTGTCPTASFGAAAGANDGSSVLLAPWPGGLLGAGFVDTNNDGILDSPSTNQFVDLSAGREGDVLTAELPDGLQAALPVFSPEGERVAFVHYDGAVEDALGTLHQGDKRSLAMLDYNRQPRSLGNYQRLTTAPAGPCAPAIGGTEPCVDVWPSFLAQRKGVVFEREVFNNALLHGAQHADFGGTRSGCETTAAGAACDDGSKGELRWVPFDVDGQPEGDFVLRRANGVAEPGQLVTDGGLGVAGVKHPLEVEPYLNYQPSAAPRSGGRYTWVAFVSRRSYGNLATENGFWSDPRVHPLAHTMPSKKIWLTAIDTQSTDDDPSAPALLLEGQDMQSANGRPVWTADACVSPSEQRSNETECYSDDDCCGAPNTSTCSLQLPVTDSPVRHCVPKVADECIEAGSEVRCQQDEECCGSDDGFICVSGQCVQPPPLARYEQGRFVRDFHAECDIGQFPAWQVLEWQAELPSGTSITFTGQTADTAAELDDAEAIPLGSALPPSTTTWTTWGTDDEDNISYQFSEAKIRAGEWLRITMTFKPDARGVQTPVLTEWRVVYDCRDNF